MFTIVVWIGIGFASGSIPWALLVCKALLGKDVRDVGDRNPGTANAWKSGGWVPGTLSLVLDIGKSLVPVYLAAQSLGQPSGPTQQAGMALIALAPIIGHAWSPFLRFKGGKAIASSSGSWIALTGGIAIPVGCIVLGLMHGLQRNHAITVTVCLIVFIAVFLPLLMEPYIVLFWIANLVILIHKYKAEYSRGPSFRSWVGRLTGALH